MTDTGIFTHSDNCVACHNNLTASTGEDISIGASWRGSIMANAARDPYFFASVRRETIDHPTKAAEIEDECARCHVPTAQRTAESQGLKARVLAGAGGAPFYRDAECPPRIRRRHLHGVSPDRPGETGHP